jgi:hypothetical protein
MGGSGQFTHAFSGEVHDFYISPECFGYTYEGVSKIFRTGVAPGRNILDTPSYFSVRTAVVFKDTKYSVLFMAL